MTKNEKKRQKVQMPAGIRNKMMAAISMLMVSVIMMVSSSYAWFTLSTAPEVTGITTNVGANGSLEMMLLNDTTYASPEKDLGVISEVGDSMAVADVLEANETWGNLVNLSSSAYGLSGVTLMPAKLNLDTNTVANTILKAPSYGSDGRVIEVETATYPGEFSEGEWVYNEAHAGVRALGTSSGTTVQLSAYRTALAAANTALINAKTAANTSLSENAQPLATLLVDKVQGATSFSKDYLTNLESIINGVTNANGYIESAIKNAVLAYSLSSYKDDNNLTDDEVNTLKNAIESAELDGLSSIAGVVVPSGISDAITIYNATQTALSTATSAYDKIKDAETDLTWEQVNGVLQPLVDQNHMQINGVNVEGANTEKLIAALLPEGTNITDVRAEIVMLEGAGVYYNIAEICGKYVVSGYVTVTHNTLGKVSAPFTMTQNVTDSNAHMVVAIAAIQAAGAPSATVGGEGTKTTLSETYGYMLDFGFRTNASGSNLLLQTPGIQRVYNSTGDTAVQETTMGGGSYMKFTSTNISTFSLDEMRALMSAIRVAFVQPDLTNSNYKMLAMGALDITATEADGVVTYAGGTPSKTVADNDTLKVDLVLKAYTKNTEDGAISLGNTLPNQTITALTQNVASKISVIVYLDGDIVDNTMVANAAQSMYGVLNLQFASSATLVPMENSGMRDGGAAIVDGTVTFESFKTAGQTHEIGDYEGKVKPGVTIWKGSDNQMYYSINDGPKYLLTTSNYMNAVEVSMSSGTQSVDTGNSGEQSSTDNTENQDDTTDTNTPTGA